MVREGGADSRERLRLTDAQGSRRPVQVDCGEARVDDQRAAPGVDDRVVAHVHRGLLEGLQVGAGPGEVQGDRVEGAHVARTLEGHREGAGPAEVERVVVAARYDRVQLFLGADRQGGPCGVTGRACG